MLKTHIYEVVFTKNPKYDDGFYQKSFKNHIWHKNYASYKKNSVFM
jgi:hypothetical protein